MSPDEQIQFLDELQTLLDKQIELVQADKVSRVEVLSKQADSLVGQIAEAGILELPEFRDRRKQLQILYDRLCLAIAAQSADVSKKISRVRRGRKTIAAYRTST